MSGTKQTPLYRKHQECNAKLVPFAGYEMPVQYVGIMQEHRRVRQSVGIFDVSHMGEFRISGERAEEFLNRMTLNDVSKLKVGKAQYSAMCYPDGGLVDDLIVYKFDDHYMIVVNAANIDKDYAWLEEHLMNGVDLVDMTDSTGLLAVQGPKSIDTLQKLTEINLSEIPFYQYIEGELAGSEMIISRTGYTGEKGFELYHDPADSEELWESVMEAGDEYDILPAGLGARDTLRMEMKYALYGNDIDKTTNPLEAGLGWITKLEKGDFIGRDALLKIKEQGINRKLVAFEMMGKGIPREGYPILKAGQRIGQVTSGTQSPSLNKGIGLGYVAYEYRWSGTEIMIQSRGKELKAMIIKPPFVPSNTT